MMPAAWQKALWESAIRLLRGLTSSRVTLTRINTSTGPGSRRFIGSLFCKNSRCHKKGNKQVGSLDLWGTRFQRNGFMEMRVKGSIVRPLIWGR